MIRSRSPAEMAAIGRVARVRTGPFRFARRPQTLAKVHEQGWGPWLAHHFPSVSAGFAPRHVRLWEWFAGLELGRAVASRVEIWPRGGAKSTTAELGVTFAEMSAVDKNRRSHRGRAFAALAEKLRERS